MTLNDLITLLEELEAEVGPDAEVRIAHQPSWPLETSIDRVEALLPELEEAYEDGEVAVVYIGEGEQLGYLPGEAADLLGW